MLEETLRHLAVAEEAESRPPALDATTLAALRALSPDPTNQILIRVFQAYQRSAPELIETLAGAIEESDAESLRRAAHKLKSSSANIGAKLISDHFKRLEEIGSEGNTEGAAEIMLEAHREYPRVLAAMIAAEPSMTGKDSS